uniref:Uncharacterized protein n=1 Tax=Tanacetum cinerariifolium TaxID=118510 RepID=A0A6L2NLX6_TANCI|nr:hypothetical protein [Tanacetum cinerariifolium]
MADLAFAPQHNMIAYLEKTEGNAEFHQILDFLTSSSIYHALIIQAIVDGKTVVIIESSVRRDLLFTDANGITCLTNKKIFKNLLLMGMKHEIELMDPVPQPPHDSSLLGGYTPESDEDSMTLKELTDLCTTLLQKVLDLEIVKIAQAKVIASLKKRVTKLEQRPSSRISGFHQFRAGMDFVIDGDADTEIIVEDKGNGEKGGSTAKTVSTARPDLSAARPEVSAAKPKTPPTTTTLFDDEDVTIADTLVKMKNLKAKEKGIAFKDVDDSARPIKSITTLQPLPSINPKDKARTERERQEEASKAALAEMYDEVQEHIDADYELAIRLTYEEQEKYTVEERFTHAQLKKDEKRIGSIKKRASSSSSKQNSPKKQKVNDQENKDSDKELKKCLKVVPDDDKAIDYETLDVKSLIVDFLDRQDALDLHKIIIKRFPANDPEGYDLILWGDLKTLVESSEDD